MGQQFTATMYALRRMGSKWLRYLAFGAFAVFASIACIRTIWGTDYFWQLRTGKLIAESGIPGTDIFSYASAGRQWLEMRWLYCLLLFKGYSLFGHGFAVVLQWVIISICFIVAAAINFDKRRAGICLAVVFIAFVASSQRFFVRPEMVSYLFVAIFLFLIIRWRENGTRLIYLLPLCQLVWTNTHTLFMLGPALLFALVIAHVIERKPLRIPTLLFLATCAATLVNPYGLAGAMFPFQLLREINGTAFKTYITELRSPFGYGMSASYAFFILLIAVVLLSAAANVRRLDSFLTIVVLSQFYLAAVAIRNLPLFCIAAIPFVFSNIRAMKFSPRADNSASALTALASIFCAWALATDRWDVWHNDTAGFGFGLARDRFALRGVEFFKRNSLPQPVFNTMTEGSNLMWADIPEFIDPRLEVHGEKRFVEYMFMQGDLGRWQKADAKYRFRSAFVDLNTPLNRLLQQSPDWGMVYFDQKCAIYVRGAPKPSREFFRRQSLEAQTALGEPADYKRAGIFGKVRPPNAYLDVANFLFAQEKYDLAAPFFQRALIAYPGAYRARHKLGQIYARQNKHSEAIKELSSAYRQTPRDILILKLLGTEYRKFGDLDKAEEILKYGVGVKDDAGLWSALGEVYVAKRDLVNATACFEKAIKLDPSVASYWMNLGAVFAARNMKTAAAEAFRKAAVLNPADPAARKTVKALAPRARPN